MILSMTGIGDGFCQLSDPYTASRPESSKTKVWYWRRLFPVNCEKYRLLVKGRWAFYAVAVADRRYVEHLRGIALGGHIDARRVFASFWIDFEKIEAAQFIETFVSIDILDPKYSTVVLRIQCRRRPQESSKTLSQA